MLWISSGFVDDVLFSYGPHGAFAAATSLTAASCTPTRPCCVILVASGRRKQRTLGLDESFVQGVAGRSVRYTIALSTS